MTGGLLRRVSSVLESQNVHDVLLVRYLKLNVGTGPSSSVTVLVTFGRVVGSDLKLILSAKLLEIGDD